MLITIYDRPNVDITSAIRRHEFNVNQTDIAGSAILVGVGITRKDDVPLLVELNVP